jgi:hypothetical protein
MNSERQTDPLSVCSQFIAAHLGAVDWITKTEVCCADHDGSLALGSIEQLMPLLALFLSSLHAGLCFMTTQSSCGPIHHYCVMLRISLYATCLPLFAIMLQPHYYELGKTAPSQKIVCFSHSCHCGRAPWLGWHTLLLDGLYRYCITGICYTYFVCFDNLRTSRNMGNEVCSGCMSLIPFSTCLGFQG